MSVKTQARAKLVEVNGFGGAQAADHSHNGRAKAELLSDAFQTFKNASVKLERQYALVEQRIEELTAELADKNAQMERNRRLAAMGEMGARIAHEIRNPLGSMALFASMLERDLEGDPDRKRLASHISKGVKTLDNLLTNMLIFAGAPAARRRNSDMREIVEDTFVMATTHRKDGVTLRAVYDGPAEFPFDAAMVRQMMINLVFNALDAVDDNGTVSVRVSIDQGAPKWMRIEVKDTGSGIKEADIDRIFDPFFTTKERGTGLGLAIVSTVVNAHKGVLEVSSKAGEGTAFVITLPEEAGEASS